MTLTSHVSQQIVAVANSCLGRPFDWSSLNCVHFVREVYAEVGVIFPLLDRCDYPPAEFHLNKDDFSRAPVGHSVFFKRKESASVRHWSHVAIIVGETHLIHCTRHLGTGVVLTPVARFFETYSLAPMKV